MLLKKIQAASLEARKTKDPVRVDLLVTLYAEAVAEGKNDGNQEATDAHVRTVLTRFLNGVNDFLKEVKEGDRRDRLLIEKEILESYLPPALSDEALGAAVAEIVGALTEKGPKALGRVMAQLKVRFADSATYDGARASALARAALAQ